MLRQAAAYYYSGWPDIEDSSIYRIIGQKMMVEYPAIKQEGANSWVGIDNCKNLLTILMHSVLWRCWLGGSKGIRPVKKLSSGMLAWLSGMRCRLAYSPADATAAHCLLLQWIQIGFTLPGFTFLVPAHPGGPRQIPEEQLLLVFTRVLLHDCCLALSPVAVMLFARALYTSIFRQNGVRLWVKLCKHYLLHLCGIRDCRNLKQTGTNRIA